MPKPFAIETLAFRRVQLGMSMAAVSARSGVPVATVRRILSGQAGQASFKNVAAVAQALGVNLTLVCGDPEVLRQQQARRKAERLIRMLQGSSALDGKAVGAEARRRLVQRTYHELLAGSHRRLWSK